MGAELYDALASLEYQRRKPGQWLIEGYLVQRVSKRRWEIWRGDILQALTPNLTLAAEWIQDELVMGERGVL